MRRRKEKRDRENFTLVKWHHREDFHRILIWGASYNLKTVGMCKEVSGN